LALPNLMNLNRNIAGREIFWFILTSLLIILSTSEIFCQGNISIHKLRMENGLSHNTVYSIIQDSEGLIWIGTKDGLNSYDGYNFKTYRYEFFDTNSISNSWINILFEDSKGYIWIGTDEGGLNRLDKRTGKSIKFRNNPEDTNSICSNTIYAIAEDTNSNIWIGTRNGISVLDNSLRNFRNYSSDSLNTGSLSSDIVYDILIDSKQRTWIGTYGGGLDLFDSSTGIFHHYKNKPGDNFSLSGDTVWQVKQDAVNKDLIWISTFSGLNCLDAATNKFTRYNYISGKTASKEDNTLQPLLIGDDNKIWMGTMGNGLNCLDLKTKKIYHIEYSPEESKSLSDNQILSLFKDRSGVIWIGTKSGGVNLLSSNNFNNLNEEKGNPESLLSGNVWAVLEQGSYLWIGTKKGLTRYNRLTGSYTHYLANRGNRSINVDIVFSLFHDSDGDLWIGTSGGGLNCLPKNSSTFRYYKYNGADSLSLSDNTVQCITQDKNGILWIGTARGGLCNFDKSTGLFKRYRPDTKNPDSLSGNYINDLVVDSDNNLWIATGGYGLNKLDNKREKFTRYINVPSDSTTVNDTYIECLYLDNDSILWLGTYSGGLNRLNTRTGKVTHFTKKDGLPSNMIVGISEDSSDNLWLSTNNGLCRFNHKSLLTINFNRNTGLENFDFNKATVFKGESGTLYFGGTNGLTWFNPGEIMYQENNSPVRIVDIEILGESLSMANNPNYKFPVDDNDTIVLDYYQSSITFEFSSLYFSDPGSTKYAYYLEGFEKLWNKSSNNNSVHYANVPPGKYVFKVKGANNYGVWSRPTEFHLILNRPFWQTAWFRLGVICFILGIVYLIIVLREYKLRRDKRLLVEKINESTSEIQQQNAEISAQRDFALQQKKKIEEQNSELEKHRSGLELLVQERTSELEIALSKAEESERLKSGFLANMSHEIRTPLNAIIGFSNLLTDNDLTDQQRDEYNNIIDHNSKMLLHLIDDILNISLIESGQLKLNKHDCSIEKIFTELEGIFSKKPSVAEDKKVRLINESTGPDLTLFTDRMRLFQILSNLIDNAIKFTEKGNVWFGYELIGEAGNQYVRFYVRDTGIGLSEKQISQLFQRFSRVADSNEKLYRGTGLGLSICKNLVELLGGNIWIESETGAGSTFYFTHPYQSDAEAVKPEGPDKNILRSELLPRKFVLIADDDYASSLLIKAILTTNNIEFLYVADGIEAVDAVKTTPVDLVLMDLNMPRMDGYDATKIIKEYNSNIKVIAQTAYCYDTCKTRALESGCDGVIFKPLKQAELMELIQELLK
jgi:signal transduction histidine kinase/ligand-binding sensor domain-containing protein/CheY-like chemotaxis protein